MPRNMPANGIGWANPGLGLLSLAPLETGDGLPLLPNPKPRPSKERLSVLFVERCQLTCWMGRLWAVGCHRASATSCSGRRTVCCWSLGASRTPPASYAEAGNAIGGGRGRVRAVFRRLARRALAPTLPAVSAPGWRWTMRPCLNVVREMKSPLVLPTNPPSGAAWNTSARIEGSCVRAMCKLLAAAIRREMGRAAATG